LTIKLYLMGQEIADIDC